MSITSQEVVATFVVDDSNVYLASNENQEHHYNQEEIESIYAAYDDMLDREAKENLPEIGYCGFPCDGKCSACGCTGGFKIEDEV